jgi:hypothetical protein
VFLLFSLTYIVSKSDFTCNNLGENSVTLSVTYDTGQSATGNAIVNVLDNISPTVVTQKVIIQLNSADKTNITTDMFNNDSTDKCGIQSHNLDKTNFNCTNVGVNTVKLTVTNVNGNTASKSAIINVQDNIAPTISSVSPSKSILWPPNHKMVPITVNIISTDNCACIGVNCKIISVTSNEPLNALGNGYTTFDWEIIGYNTVNLRTERSGTGDGHIYTITVESTYASGNKTRSKTTVSVPHNGPVREGISEIENIEALNIKVLGNPTASGVPFILIMQSNLSDAPIMLND